MLRLASLFKRRTRPSIEEDAPPGAVPPPSGFSKEAVAQARATWSRSDWQRIRAPDRQRDQVLSAKATRWLAWLPTEVRPDRLANRYPRIVNRLAACWRDVGITGRLLDELLADERGDRQGFAADIVAELDKVRRLHQLRLERRRSADDDWPSTVPS